MVAETYDSTVVALSILIATVALLIAIRDVMASAGQTRKVLQFRSRQI
jgi:hypothetical protein